MIEIKIDESALNPDLGAKMQSLGQTLQDLFTWIVAHQNELQLQGFFVDAFQDKTAIHNSQQMLARLKEVLTKSAATISGYHKELELASKQIAKERTIHFGSRGDLSVDYPTTGGAYGKAIQSKSCFSASHADVDEHIKKAALQLTGEKMPAETPLATDRRIVDISIKNANNRWPKTDSDMTPLTFGDITDRIRKYVSEYVVGKKGYNKFGELSGGLGGGGSQSQRTGRFISRPATGGVDLVVKIRWDTPRPVRCPDHVTRMVNSVAVRVEDNQGVKQASVVRYTFMG